MNFRQYFFYEKGLKICEKENIKDEDKLLIP